MKGRLEIEIVRDDVVFSMCLCIVYNCCGDLLLQCMYLVLTYSSS